MTLESWGEPGQLYLTRGDEVVTCRPLFTGDVLDDIEIPGVQAGGPGIVVAHPCSMRGKDAVLSERLLVAAVEPADPTPAARWETGFFDRMPLPELRGESSFDVAWLDRIGRALSTSAVGAVRLACLSQFGVNLLQQRLIYSLSRLDVPTTKLWEAFAHTYEEADLLEEWLEDGVPSADAVAFETWIRDGDPSRQSRLRDPQQRATVRADMRAELRGRRAN